MGGWVDPYIRTYFVYEDGCSVTLLQFWPKPAACAAEQRIFNICSCTSAFLRLEDFGGICMTFASVMVSSDGTECVVADGHYMSAVEAVGLDGPSEDPDSLLAKHGRKPSSVGSARIDIMIRSLL